MTPDHLARLILDTVLACVIAAFAALLALEVLADEAPISRPVPCVEVPCTAADIEERTRWRALSAWLRAESRRLEAVPGLVIIEDGRALRVCVTVGGATECRRLPGMLGA